MILLQLLPERPELLHPAIVHFPIVLILISTLAFALIAFVPSWKGFLPIVAIALALGALSAWIAVNTGEIAEEIVEEAEHNGGNHVPHDLIHEHEEHGEAAANLSSAAAVLFLAFLALAKRMKPWMTFAAKVLILALLLLSSLQVLAAARHGGELVFDYGAGVKVHQEE